MLATRPHTEDASRVAETRKGRGSKLGRIHKARKDTQGIMEWNEMVNNSNKCGILI